MAELIATAASAASGGRGLVEPLRYNDWRQVAVAMTRPMKSTACAA